MKYIFLRISFPQTLMHSVCMSANKTSKKYHQYTWKSKDMHKFRLLYELSNAIKKHSAQHKPYTTRCYAAMLTRKVICCLSRCFLYPSFVSIFTHYAPPFEIFFLLYNTYFIDRWLENEWDCLCPHSYNRMHTYMRKPNSLLACTWLTVNFFFCFFSPLHTQFSSFQNIQPLCCWSFALLSFVFISWIELIFIIFYISVWFEVDEIKYKKNNNSRTLF